jgi:hypothetical protein
LLECRLLLINHCNMAHCLYQFILFCLLLLPAFAPDVAAQNTTTDLRKDMPFFRKKQKEFNDWLRRNQLGHIFRADSVAATAKKVTLFIRPAYNSHRACDSLQCAWNHLDARNMQQFDQHFYDRLLHKWAFLSEVHEAQCEVIVRCHEPAHFMARISNRQGDISITDGRNVRSAAVMQVSLPGSLESINVGDSGTLLRGQKASSVCRKARTYLAQHYKNKGTPILWRARIDTSFVLYDEFVMEVTHLSDEICPDNYFEYHRIYLKGVQKGDDVEISWEFQGKYGSGIAFPPRKNDYKDMDTKYKENLEEYQNHLFRQLLEYLRR